MTTTLPEVTWWEHINAIRARLSIPHEDLATAAGISRATLYRKVSGEEPDLTSEQQAAIEEFLMRSISA